MVNPLCTKISVASASPSSPAASSNAFLRSYMLAAHCQKHDCGIRYIITKDDGFGDLIHLAALRLSCLFTGVRVDRGFYQIDVNYNFSAVRLTR